MTVENAYLSKIVFCSTTGICSARSFIERIYELDSKMDDHRIALIGEGYERKIDLFRQFQLGEDPNKIKFSVSRQRSAAIDTKDIIISESDISSLG